MKHLQAALGPEYLVTTPDVPTKDSSSIFFTRGLLGNKVLAISVENLWKLIDKTRSYPSTREILYEAFREYNPPPLPSLEQAERYVTHLMTAEPVVTMTAEPEVKGSWRSLLTQPIVSTHSDGTPKAH